MKIEKYEYFHTVGKLLDFIEKNNIPRDGKILVQRVEDFYFEKNNWKTIDMPGHQYYMAEQMKNKALSGVFDDRKKYPKMTDKTRDALANQDLEPLKDKYIVSFCAVKHDDDNLYIDCHY